VIRDIKRLTNEEFDILIIGGGISGAAIAWDAALRGHKTALIEKNDFGSATSAATSKLIHGGLRYLSKLDIRVVRESLRERRLLEQNISYQAFPLSFLLPVYNYYSKPGWMINIGLSLYDILSYDRNDLKDPDKHLGKHRWLSKKEALKLEPALSEKGLKGAYHYYDVLNKHPERSNLDFILSAVEKGAVAVNYMNFQKFLLNSINDKKTVTGITAKDEITKTLIDIKAKVTVNATGPWGDIVLSKLHKNPVKTLTRSKGIHILVPRIQKNTAITLETKDKHHFFIIPWLDYSLIGTTDTAFTGNSDDLKVTKKDIESFIKVINDNYPVNLKYEQVLHAYAGIRPLVSESKTANTYETSRKHEIVDHKKVENIKGLVSVFGGKWTTSRSLAEETVNKLEKLTGLERIKCKTDSTSLNGDDVGERLSNFIDEAVEKWSGKFSIKLIHHLIEYYGSYYEKILKLAQKNPKLLEPLEKGLLHIKAEIIYAVEDESAVKLSDVLLRRCGIGNRGLPSDNCINETADLMAKILKWDKKTKNDEISSYKESQKITD